MENYRKAHRDFTAAEEEAGLKAENAWIDLRERMQTFSDYVGANFAPTLTTALGGIGTAFERLATGGQGWFSKLAAEISASKTIGPDVEAIKAGLERDMPGIKAALGDVTPDPEDQANKLATFVRSIADTFKIVDELKKGSGADVSKILDWMFPDDAIERWKAKWAANFAWLKGLTQTDRAADKAAEALPDTPSMIDKFRSWAASAAPPPPAAPQALTGMSSEVLRDRAAAPPVAPPAMPEFKALSRPPGAVPALPRPAFSPISFNPDEGSVKPPNPLANAGGGGSSASTSDAINIIAVGTRRGVYDGLYDFWTAMKTMKDAAGGGLGGLISKASYEPGGGAGGGEGPAGKIGADVRHQRDGGEGGGGAGGGRLMDALAQIESGNRNIFSKVDPDVAGPGTRSQGYFQINTPTWREFAKKAGVDVVKYPSAMKAPRDVQEEVAATIPLARFGPRTRRMLAQEFGPLDTKAPVGTLGPRDVPAPAAPSGKTAGTLTTDFSGLRLKSAETTAGGAAEEGLVALARHEQEMEGKNLRAFTALRDRFHVFENPSSFHNRGLAFDAALNKGDYAAGRQRMKTYLDSLGLKEGDMRGRGGDYAIEPGTGNHLHVQFNSREAAERYYALARDDAKPAAVAGATPIHEALAKHGAELRKLFGWRGEHQQLPPPPRVPLPPGSAPGHSPLPAGQQEALLERREPGDLRRESGDLLKAQGEAVTHRVSGEASLRVSLDDGLKPRGGIRTKGDLFREIKLDRASPAVAGTEA